MDTRPKRKQRPKAPPPTERKTIAPTPRVLLNAVDRFHLICDLTAMRDAVVKARSDVEGLSRQAADRRRKAGVLRQVSGASAALLEAEKYLDEAIVNTQTDAQPELLMILLEQLFDKHAAGRRSGAVFEADLGAILFGLGLPPPNKVLRRGSLTPEEMEIVNSRLTHTKPTEEGEADPDTKTVVETLIKSGLPDIRTSLGKASIDVFPTRHDTVACVVAGRILGESARNLQRLKTASRATLETHGDLFTRLW